MPKRNLTSKKTASKVVATKSPVRVANMAKFKSDARQTASLVKAGRTGSANAIRASRALGLPITYLQDGTIYQEYPDGTKKKIGSGAVKKRVVKKTGQTLKKGMVLHAKK